MWKSIFSTVLVISAVQNEVFEKLTIVSIRRYQSILYLFNKYRLMASLSFRGSTLYENYTTFHITSSNFQKVLHGIMETSTCFVVAVGFLFLFLFCFVCFVLFCFVLSFLFFLVFLPLKYIDLLAS